ncbi:MAG: cytochrome c [Glaciimonas sp.]|nr:cytochrome c [Glaciimonas sp.]
MKQCTKYVIAGLGLIFSTAVFATDTVANTSTAISAARRVELISLVRQDCGSCHGLTLKGGLGPALLPEALKDKPADYLKSIILHGRPDTAMPPWQRFLSEAEAEWIVFNLQKGFPSEH